MRTRYTQQQKQEILDYYSTHTITETSRKFHINKSTIRYWTDPTVREKSIAMAAKHQIVNKKQHAKTTKKYFEKNKDKVHQMNADNYQKNKEKIKEKHIQYLKKKRNEDALYRILENCRNRVYNLIKNGKKSHKTLVLLGCDMITLKKHLEKQFTEGMAWDNYGEWHVDHIKPCCLFDFSKESEQKECFHYTNLQPLWAIDNLKKNASYEQNLLPLQNPRNPLFPQNSYSPRN